MDSGDFTDPPDTSLIVDFCYPGGGTYQYSMEAIEKMVDYRYRSARAATQAWKATPDGADLYPTELSWDAPVNMHMISADFIVWEDGSTERTTDEIKEYVEDKIDYLYTDRGKASFNTFAHNYSMNKLTPVNLAYTIDLITSLNSIQYMPYSETITLRDNGRIHPDGIAGMDIMSTDSTAIKASAAIADSLISLMGHDNLLESWVGPRTEVFNDLALRLTYPVYGAWDNDPKETLTAEDYQLFAASDVSVLDHLVWINECYVGLVDEVRAYNPDWIPLIYTWGYGLNVAFEGYARGTFYGDLWGAAIDNDFFARTTYPVSEIIWSTGEWPGVAMLNPFAPGLADTMGAIYAYHLNKQDLNRHHVGYFVDWHFQTFYGGQWSWATDIRDSLDMDQDGNPYGDGSVEEAFNVAYLRDFPRAYREAADNPTLLIMPNGNVHFKALVADVFDGGMNEDMHINAPQTYPYGRAEWDVASTTGYGKVSRLRVDPGLIMFQARDDSIGYASEALSAIMRGISCFANDTAGIMAPDRKHDFGVMTGPATWSGDTVTAEYLKDDVTTFIRVVEENYIWSYLVTTSNGDTLSVGGGWPRQDEVAVWDTVYIAATGDSTQTNGARGLMGYYFETGGLRDSLKTNGGPYDYIIDADNARDRFAYAHIDMANPTSRVTNDWTHIEELYFTETDQWSGATNQIFMHYFPLEDLPGFDDTSCEVISASYSLFWRAGSYAQGAADTMWAAGSNLDIFDWYKDGNRWNTSRTYQVVDEMRGWPKLNGSNDPNDWGPLGLSAISDLDYKDHAPAVLLETDEAGNSLAYAWDMTPWAQDVSGAGGGTNAGIWFLGVKNGAAHSQLRFGGFSSTDVAQWRTVFKMKYRYRENVEVEPLQFALFNDNHSNHPAVTAMGAAMDADGFVPRFLVHNGDMNSGTDCAELDTTLAHQDTLADLWREVPIALVAGNHELGDACDEFFTDVLPFANVAFMDSIEAMGGVVHSLGSAALGTEYLTFSVELNNVHLTFFNPYTITAGITISNDELQWLEDDFGSSTAAVKLLFMHFPSWDDTVDLYFPDFETEVGINPFSNWDDVQAVLKQHEVEAVFAGHRHIMATSEYEGTTYYTNTSSNADDLSAPQGFATISIDAAGEGTVRSYRSADDGEAEGPYTYRGFSGFGVDVDPGARIELALPVKGHWGWGTFQDPLTDADYDFAAQFDVYLLPHEALILDRFDDFVLEVRKRNPDFMALTYFWGYGVEDWSASDRIYKSIYDMAINNDFLSKNVNGELILGAYDAFHFNPLSVGLADSLAVIFKEYSTDRGNNLHHTGVFFDWFASPMSAWAYIDSLEFVDWDQDGIPRGTDVESAEWLQEESYNTAFIEGCAPAFRAVMDDSTFLFLPNLSSNRYATLMLGGEDWDGAMYEIFQAYYPTSNESNMQTAILGDYERLNNSRVNPPLFYWQGGEHDAGETSELLAAIARGSSSYHLDSEANYQLPAPIHLGWLVGEPVWSATLDTLTAEFSSEVYDTTVRLIQELGDDSQVNLPWRYIAITAEGDTLRRGGGWVREKP
ncbi:MAG: metallophosphoesterase [Deltaproteobacteria bacterium]|nr:metallophosphoesterase [Deltaproteobacteria bacterium]